MGTILLNHDTVLKDSVVTTDSFSDANKRIDDTNKRIDDIIEANAELKKYIDASNRHYYYESLAAIYNALTTIFLVIYLAGLAYFRSANITISIGYHVIFIVAMVITIGCNLAWDFFASFISSDKYKRKK